MADAPGVSEQNEDQVAAEVVGFLQQFLEVFKELQHKKLYVTGESVSSCRAPGMWRDADTGTQYAGMYVPCEYLMICDGRGLTSCC